jgi:hypothetical protein
LTNTTNTQKTVTYTLTPTAGDCTGSTFTIAVVVNPSTQIGTQPSGNSYCVGGTATALSVGATGTGTLSYQWYNNGTTNSNSGGNPVGTNDASFTPSTSAVGTTYYYVVVTSDCSTVTSNAVAVVINPNNICAAYTGDVFVNTSTPTSGTATVNVEFTVSPGSNPNNCNSTTGLTVDDFVITVASQDPPNTGVSLVAGSVNYANQKLTAQYTVTLPNGAYSATVLFTLATSSTSSFVLGNNCTDNALVTVSTKVDGFVTGGGYILQNNTCKTYGGPSNVGYKNNFGFNIKYNKAGTKPQGTWTSIFRRMENGVVHTYQLKSTQASSLTVSQFTATSYRASFTFTGGNLKDLTNNSSTVASGLTINVVIWDNGEPGGGVDGIYYEVLANNGNVIYKSDCNGSFTSLIPLINLVKGNIQIHMLGSKAAPTTTREVQSATVTTLGQSFQVTASPNPSFSYFNLNIAGNNAAGLVNMKVTDVLGRVVEANQNLAPGQTLRIGSDYRPGVYIVQVMQGDTVKQLKLVKQ